jgi:hypothetical protein
MADLINQTLTKRIQDGFLQYDYTETYQVTAAGIASACIASGVPQIGQAVLLSGTSDYVWCHTQAPNRRSDRDAKNLYTVTCSFSNASTKYERDVEGNPVSNPEDIVPKLDIGFDEYSEPATDAHLLGFTDASEADPFTAAIKTPPPYLQERQSLDYGNFIGGPVVNSANDPAPNINQRRHNKRMTYWTWHRDWNPQWEQYLDRVNAFSLTLSQYDQEGIRLQYTFPPLTVVINDLMKEDHWRNGKLYFRRGIAMMHNPRGWLTKINDEGVNEALFSGQYKGSGATKFTAGDLTTNDTANRSLTAYKQPIVEESIQLKDEGQDGIYVAPAGPIQLNGYGRQLGCSTPDASGDSVAKCGWYLTYRPADFASLGMQ